LPLGLIKSVACFDISGVVVGIGCLQGGAMTRKRKKRRLTLTNVSLCAGILGVVIAAGALRSGIETRNREHESRRASDAIAANEALSKSVGRWYKGAKLVYRASLKTWEATGRWPRGTESEAYEVVIDAGTDVTRLKPSVRDRKLVRLLDALRSDIGTMCGATSVRVANRAAAKMVRHFEDASARIGHVRIEQTERLRAFG
jgi:hypothetical protein